MREIAPWILLWLDHGKRSIFVVSKIINCNEKRCGFWVIISKRPSNKEAYLLSGYSKETQKVKMLHIYRVLEKIIFEVHGEYKIIGIQNCGYIINCIYQHFYFMSWLYILNLFNEKRSHILWRNKLLLI